MNRKQPAAKRREEIAVKHDFRSDHIKLNRQPDPVAAGSATPTSIKFAVGGFYTPRSTGYTPLAGAQERWGGPFGGRRIYGNCKTWALTEDPQQVTVGTKYPREWLPTRYHPPERETLEVSDVVENEWWAEEARKWMDTVGPTGAPGGGIVALSSPGPPARHRNIPGMMNREVEQWREAVNGFRKGEDAWQQTMRQARATGRFARGASMSMPPASLFNPAFEATDRSMMSATRSMMSATRGLGACSSMGATQSSFSPSAARPRSRGPHSCDYMPRLQTRNRVTHNRTSRGVLPDCKKTRGLSNSDRLALGILATSFDSGISCVNLGTASKPFYPRRSNSSFL